MVQVARLVTTTAVVGGVLAGSLALGAGLATAAPAPTALVPASCGQTVSALPGDTVRVKPQLGAPRDYTVGGSPGTTAHIQTSMGMCNVAVRMLAPAPVAAPAYAPMYAAPAPAPGAVAPGAAAPGAPAQRIAPAAPMAAAPLAAAPAHRAEAAAPAKPAPHASRPAAASSPAGSMAEAPLPALPAGSAAALLGAPAPAPAPAPVADAASHVVATSNNSALAPDASDGTSVPILIALVAGTGVAAFGVRMLLLRRGATPAPAAGPSDPADVVDDDATVLHTGLAGAHRSA